MPLSISVPLNGSTVRLFYLDLVIWQVHTCLLLLSSLKSHLFSVSIHLCIHAKAETTRYSGYLFLPLITPLFCRCQRASVGISHTEKNIYF